MDKIPISFEYKGQYYCGYFNAVHGVGSNVWFLSIDNYHRGQLIRTENFGWQFCNNKNEMKELTDYFAEVVMAWYC